MYYDVIIVGGSLGGAAAALSAGSSTYSVCLFEASDWIGGQFSSQGVTKPDENRYIESVGSTANYRNFRHAVRAFYRNNYRLSSQGAGQPTLNPGGPYPGFSTEPRAASNVLLQRLQARPNIHVRLNTHITTVDVQGDQVQSVTAVGPDGTQTVYTAKYFLDATDLGDLLPMANVEHALGAEAKSDTGEPNAPDTARPDWIQPITSVVALEHRPSGENHTIAPPPNYATLKTQQNYTVVDGYISKVFQAGVDMWTYRRYIDAANFNDPAFPNDLSMLNMGANDYQGATPPSGSATQDAAIIGRARQAALGFVYWLQTEVRRDDGSGNGYPNLKVRTDQFGTSDGTSAQPYIREGRRIKARYTIVQQDLDQAYRGGPRAKNYPDSCGIGFYGGLDIHALAAVGMPQQFITIWPFQIPLRSLIPVRVTNLIPACKNIGTTHITNGAYRLHPVEWNIGESAGMLARFAIANNVSPGTVATTPTLLRSFQHLLLSVGVPLFWWTDITVDNPQLFSAVQLLGVDGIMSGNPDMSYAPNAILTDLERADIDSAVGRQLNWPATTMTRGQAALWLVNQLAL